MKSHTHRYDIVLVCADSSSNTMGRALSLWELAQEIGMSAGLVAAEADRLWPPLQGSRMADCVFAVNEVGGDRIAETVTASVIVCLKPVAPTLEIAVPWSRESGVPLLLDIDDPDIDVGLSIDSPIRALAKTVLRRRDMRWLRWARSHHDQFPKIVSNPVLQAQYGGTLIPHVHKLGDSARPTEPPKPQDVAFVGTVRQHKGIRQLRQGVAAIADRGFTLTITGEAPRDAHSWETWVSNNTLAEGRQIVRDAGIVAIPSLDSVVARGQLPSKLIESMTMGKAIVASDLPPIRWALGDTGILVPPGDVDALSRAIASLEDQRLRRRLAEKARARSKRLFAIENYTSTFSHVLDSAIAAQARSH